MPVRELKRQKAALSQFWFGRIQTLPLWCLDKFLTVTGFQSEVAQKQMQSDSERSHAATWQLVSSRFLTKADSRKMQR